MVMDPPLKQAERGRAHMAEMKPQVNQALDLETGGKG